MRKRLYSEQRKKPDEQQGKQNAQKRTHKLQGTQRQELSANSLMPKRLEWQPKKPARAPPDQVLCPDCEGGLDGLAPKILRRGERSNWELTRALVCFVACSFAGVMWRECSLHASRIVPNERR